MPKKRLTAYLLLTLTAAIWGVAGPVIKATLVYLPSFTFLFWRFLITAVIFIPLFIFFFKKEKETLKSILPIVPIGFLGIPLCLSFVFLGFERTTTLDGTVIAAIAPIFIVLGGVFFLKEKVTKLETMGLVVAIAGSVVMISQPLLEGGGFAHRNLLGNIFIILSDIAWAGYVIASKKEFKKHSPLIITSVSLFTGLVAIFPLALLEKGPQIFNFSSLISNPTALWGVLYMALLSSALAFFAFESGLRLIEASEATLFAYLQPIFAAPLAIFWLKESITVPFLIGAGIIIIGVFLTEYKTHIKPRIYRPSAKGPYF